MDTDTALAVAAGVSMTVCGICIVVNAWRNSRTRGQMKHSRSDGDLTSILDNAIPSASASRREEATPDTP